MSIVLLLLYNSQQNIIIIKVKNDGNEPHLMKGSGTRTV